MSLFRAWLALGVTCAGLLVSDVVQRFVISPWVKLRPSRRIPVLGRWIQAMAWLVTRPIAVLGGCVIPRPARMVPTGPGVLIVMNHQSLFDIPLVIQTVVDGYPRIVTRKRYARYIPLISHMVGLYQYPVVDPSANAKSIRAALDALERAAADSDVPIAVFPEGTRTRDGQLGRFKTGALSRILATRSWTVHVFVADGFWRTAKFKDFVRGVQDVRGRMEQVAVLEWPDPEADSVPFIEEIRSLMVDRLAEMRRVPPDA